MALAKDRMPPSSFYETNMMDSLSPPLHFADLASIHPSSSFYDFEGDHFEKQHSPKGDVDGDSANSSSANSSNGSALQADESQSVITFDGTITSAASYGCEFMQKGEPLLSFRSDGCLSYSFGHPNEYPLWQDSGMSHEGGNQPDFSCIKEPVTAESPQESTVIEQTSFINKRSLMAEENVKTSKRKRNSGGAPGKRPSMLKSGTSTSKDPQSLAAKNRRERISERLKVLQDLVPNGSKVDMVTMLEKAISYVKFLQLQVKVLAADEFWPVAGGKAPSISQVREAIDAILIPHQSG